MMSFSRVKGQERAIAFLKQAIATEKLPHAYLFTGIPGIGKTTTAKAFATVLNCLEPRGNDGCGRCRICRQMDSSNFPDFVKLEPEAQHIRIDQIRLLNRTLSFAPLAAKYRVCVLSRAEAMTDEAANAFLKTLEEPPAGNILILTAKEPLDLLPTIVSRCQIVPFHPLSSQQITHWLGSEMQLDTETAVVLARISGGSLGRAVKNLENGFLERRQEWISRLIKLPSLPGEEALELAVESAGEFKKGTIHTSENEELNLLDLLEVWASWYRDLLIIKVGASNRLLMNADFSHQLKNMAAGFILDSLCKCISLLDLAMQDLRKQRNTLLVMEQTVLNLARLARKRKTIH